MVDPLIRSRKFNNITTPVYHGTSSHHYSSLIKGIDLNKSRDYLDFGKGFYLTTDFRQASKHAKNKSKNFDAQAIVFVYNLDRRRLRSCTKGKIFHSMDLDWANFIYSNRSNVSTTPHGYDYVFGGVADGTDLLTRIQGLDKEYQKTGQIDTPFFLENIAKYLYDQLAICNEIIIRHEILKLEKVVLAYDKNSEFIPEASH